MERRVHARGPQSTVWRTTGRTRVFRLKLTAVIQADGSLRDDLIRTSGTVITAVPVQQLDFRSTNQAGGDFNGELHVNFCLDIYLLLHQQTSYV